MRALPAWAATFAMLLGTWELYRVVQSLRSVFRRHQRREQVRFDCLVPVTIVNRANELSLGRVVDVSTSGVGLLVSEETEVGKLLQLNFTLPGLDGERLPVALTTAVQSVRRDRSPGWRIGASILEMSDLSRANLVRYCWFVHPCERLRRSRLEAEHQTVPLIPIAPAASGIQAEDADSQAAIERPAVG